MGVPKRIFTGGWECPARRLVTSRIETTTRRILRRGHHRLLVPLRANGLEHTLASRAKHVQLVLHHRLHGVEHRPQQLHHRDLLRVGLQLRSSVVRYACRSSELILTLEMPRATAPRNCASGVPEPPCRLK